VSGTQRSEQIRAVALEALYERGYHAMSLRELAREIGLQAPSLYNYFSSKQELLFGLMKSVMEALHERVVAAITESGPSYRERLRAGLYAFVLFNAEHPHEAAVSDAGFKALTPENRKTIVQIRDEFEALFTGLLDGGVETGEFAVGDVSVIRNSMLSSCARIHFWYRSEGSCRPDQLAELVSNYLVGGVVAGAETARRSRENRHDGNCR
jgi:AcrR family transcriptional regulator